MTDTSLEKGETGHGSSVPQRQAPDMIQLPRRIVYFQAALLGLAATTFFIFGIMVGSLSPRSNPAFDHNQDVRVAGVVFNSQRGERVPAAGAVVFLLPESPAEISRQHPQTVRPESFEPLENPTIDWIRYLGGAVVRTNISGKFEVFAKPGKYNLLVISKVSQRSDPGIMSKQLVASISQYFLPVEQLIDDRQYYWQLLDLNKEAVDVNDIVFE